MKTILVVTDELEMMRTLCKNLGNAGYRVVDADDGQTALTLLRCERPDRVLLDLALPALSAGSGQGLSGLEVCRRLHQISGVPILVFTNCLEKAERMVTQEMCADDFVLKPFNPRQATARIQALLNRFERRSAARRDVIQAGDLALDPNLRRATVAGKRVDLTRTELDLLAALASRPGRAFTRPQLIQALDSKRSISGRTIDSNIKNLRGKIEPDPRQPRYILTVYGVGYKLSERRVASGKRHR